MNSTPLVSIVIPLYNEIETLPHLMEKLNEVISREEITAEILIIDDGSNDGSTIALDEVARNDKKVKVLHFKRNRGKSAALDAGFRMAEGEYVVSMDADLQDDPEEIPNLMSKIDEGYDMVSGWKKKRHDPLSKTMPSKLFNFTARLASGIKLHDFNCGLKIYRREVVKSIRIYGEFHRFIPVLAGSQGFRVGELVVKHHPRKWGKTKYGMSRLIKGFLDLLSVIFLTRFTSSPMHLFGAAGLISSLVGFGILAYLSIGWFMGNPIGNRPLFFLGILLMITGIQLFSIGLIGEMISHMRITSQFKEPEENWIE